MIHRAFSIVAIVGAFSLQSCVAALVPVAAGGVLIKTRVDAAKRTRKAEASMQDAPKPVVIVGNGANNSDLPSGVSTATGSNPPTTDPLALPIPEIPGMPKKAGGPQMDLGYHPYRDFARYALVAADNREAALSIRSAVLIEQVSLANPKTISCDYKPLAVIIDLDPKTNIASSDQASEVTLGETIEVIRQRGIKIIWLTDKAQAALPEFLGTLRIGQVPAIKSDDLISFGANKGKRKQERRWKLAENYCIAAVAGDAKSDFDELYDYLRNPGYATRLDAFWDRGWFLLPQPLSVAGNQKIQTMPEMEEPR